VDWRSDARGYLTPSTEFPGERDEAPRSCSRPPAPTPTDRSDLGDYQVTIRKAQASHVHPLIYMNTIEMGDMTATLPVAKSGQGALSAEQEKP
jgi:hypothetical protein